MVLQLGSQITLARLLGPDQYGVFAIGATVISFTAFFSDIGLAYGLIQKAQVDDRDVRFVFTWQIILGTTVTGLVWFASAPIAKFFGEPRAANVVQILAILCIVNALTAPSLNLLKRELDFKKIQIAQLSSYLIGYLLVGIPLALSGFGVWALVAAWVAQASVNLVALYWSTRHPLRPLLWYDQGRDQSRYGGTVLLTNMVNWIINNIDRVIVGRVFGSRDIGLYATSYNLFYTPSSAVLGVVQPVFFSASSRVADDPDRILRAYKSLLGMVTGIFLPMFVCVAVLSEPFIAVLYGPQWHTAASLCRPIALAMPFFILWGLTTPLLWTSGKVASEFQIQLPVAVAWAGVCYIASQYSLQAVAWSVLGLSMLRCSVVASLALRRLQSPVAEVWTAAKSGIGVSLLMASAAGGGSAALAAQHPGLRLFGGLALATLVWLVLPRFFPGLMSDDLRQLITRVLNRLPSGARKCCAAVLPLGGPRRG